jgi:hypothetical protein
VEGWRYGDYYDASQHNWIGTLGTTVTNGSPALSAEVAGLTYGVTAEFETDLCPNAAILNLTNYMVSFDYYLLTTSGTPFSVADGDNNDMFMASDKAVLLSCQPFPDIGSDHWYHATCPLLPDTVTNLTLIFRIGPGWGGKVFIDNVAFTPK